RFFCRLIDMSLNPDCHRPGPKGQVLIGQMKLGTLLCCSERTIRSWTRELEAQRYIWTLRVPQANTDPVLRYHVSVFIEPKQMTPHVRGQAMIGNCRTHF